MKKTWIWIICGVMGASFLILLYLQMNYAQTMVSMRLDQFDETVFRSLDQASHELERNETFNYLQAVIAEHERERARAYLSDSLQVVYKDSNTDSVLTATGYVPSVLRNMPKVRISPLGQQTHNRWRQSTAQFQRSVRNAYIYERNLLDEVVLRVLYNASDKHLRNRLDVLMLDHTIKQALERNGVTLPFHFVVYAASGQEIFRCPDYEEKGNDHMFTQTLFRNDPSGRMGYVQVHFPTMKSYIMGIVRIFSPAMTFTLIMFFTFMVTVYLIVRQKRDSQMKNDFINNMTHEFKTPLSTISIAAQMLSDESVNKTEATYARLGNAINTETRRLRFQVEKVLQMSLYDHDNIAMKIRSLDAHELIDNVVQIFSLKTTQHGGRLQTRLEATTTMVDVDEMHFTNIIFNLMDNAVKYCRPDVPLELQVSTWNKGASLCISVQDNGIGISRENVKRVFERFFRVHTGNTHNVKGFGLGLAYVKRMVDLQRGDIHVQSELGKGTKFLITLPNSK